MTDRTLINNGKGSILKCPSDYNPASFAEFLADFKNGLFADINPNNSTDSDAGVTEVGTPLNKAHLLTDETAQGYGFDASDDASVNDVLNRMVDYIEGTLASNQNTLILTDSRIKTTSVYEIFTDVYSVYPKNVSVSNGSMTIEFYNHTQSVNVKVRVY